MMKQVIYRKFGVQLSESSVCRLLVQLGLTPQRPVWRAYQQRPEEVQKWLEERYPRIRALAKQKKAMIFFGDEAGVCSDQHAGTTWAVKSKTPVVSSSGAKFGLNLIFAVSAQGAFRFMTGKGQARATQLIEFIMRLLHNMPRKVFLIADGCPALQGENGNAFCRVG